MKTEPIAYLVAERRLGKWLLTDEFSRQYETLDEAQRVAAADRAAGTDAGVFAVVPVNEAVAS